jgi:phosphoribosyl-ATP pyrophosphohydrolase
MIVDTTRDALEAQMIYTTSAGVRSALWAMENYPQPNYVAAKLGEEAGEVIRAYIHMVEGRATLQQLEGEVAQLIGLALRLLHEGDETIKANAAKVVTR